jgi:repressor LexA
MMTTAITLTEKQEKVLAYVRSYAADNGFPPTTREIATHMGYTDHKVVRYQLKRLERAGRLTISPGASRGIRLNPSK